MHSRMPRFSPIFILEPKAKTGGARIILFKGVFADAIDDKEKFLKECSQLDGITCVDVDADKESDTSIALTIKGSTSHIENAEKSFKRDGLDLPSFQKLELDGKLHISCVYMYFTEQLFQIINVRKHLSGDEN